MRKSRPSPSRLLPFQRLPSVKQTITCKMHLANPSSVHHQVIEPSNAVDVRGHENDLVSPSNANHHVIDLGDVSATNLRVIDPVTPPRTLNSQHQLHSRPLNHPILLRPNPRPRDYASVVWLISLVHALKSPHLYR